MGRPPIGKTAMTGAERVRRFRLKHGTSNPVTKRVTKFSADDVEPLKARIRDLEQAMRAQIHPKPQQAATDDGAVKAASARSRMRSPACASEKAGLSATPGAASPSRQPNIGF